MRPGFVLIYHQRSLENRIKDRSRRGVAALRPEFSNAKPLPSDVVDVTGYFHPFGVQRERRMGNFSENR